MRNAETHDINVEKVASSAARCEELDEDLLEENNERVDKHGRWMKQFSASGGKPA